MTLRQTSCDKYLSVGRCSIFSANRSYEEVDQKTKTREYGVCFLLVIFFGGMYTHIEKIYVVAVTFKGVRCSSLGISLYHCLLVVNCPLPHFRILQNRFFSVFFFVAVSYDVIAVVISWKLTVTKDR